MAHFDLGEDSWIFHGTYYGVGHQACWAGLSFFSRRFKSPHQLEIEGERYIGLILDGEIIHSEIRDAQLIW
jgi:hypothetical protein